ncbi:MAG TPA: hypothetical protein VGD65_04330 [Chryseosolibacter sp.]
MKAMLRFLIFSVFLGLAGCMADPDSSGITIFSENFDFSQSQHGWQHGFAEYPTGVDDSTYYELKYAYQPEPGGSNSIMLSGNNRSTELFMYIKRKLEGLSPNTVYTLTFNVSLFSDAQQGLTGTVAAGENVFLKVGATAIEPKSLIDRNRYIMNIDKGSLDESGNDMIAIGNLSVPSGSYTQINRTNSTNMNSPFRVKSNSRGEIWLIVGTDSGSSGKTTLYYSKIYLTLSAAN